MGLGLGIGLSPALSKGVGDPIQAIFADGTDGFYFDFSKTDRLFQNTTGTPADDAGENIGLGLESHGWGGRTLAEQIAATTPALNYDFSSSSGWTLQADLAISGGKLTCTAATATRGAYKAVGLTSGSYHRVTFDVDSVSGGNVTAEFCNDANGSSGTGVTITFNTTGTKTLYILAGSQTGIRFRFQSGTTAQIDNLRVDRIPGNHGLQATAAAQPKWQTGGLARFDGSDDNLLTTLNPALAGTLMLKVKPAGGAVILVGSNDAGGNARAFLATDSSNLLAGGMGADSLGTIKGGSSVAGQTGVAALAWDGSTVRLYWNGAAIYSAAQNGAPNTTVPFRLGSNNSNGTAASFAACDIYHALAIKKALSAAQIAAITNKWGTS